MHAIPLPPQPGRRACLTLALASALVLGGCATAPPVDTRAQTLQAMGFHATPTGWEFSLTGKLLFDTDSNSLDAQSQSTTDRLGRELGILQVDLVRVEGHTDNVGSAAYNQALSLRRAQAVADALAQAGLHGAKIEVRGLGMTHPVSGNSTPEMRQQNRRVSIIVPAQ